MSILVTKVCDVCGGTSEQDTERKWIVVKFETDHTSYNGNEITFSQDYCSKDCAMIGLKELGSGQGREKISIKRVKRKSVKISTDTEEVLNRDGNRGSMVSF